jgi:hypothetical protein
MIQIWEEVNINEYYEIFRQIGGSHYPGA